MNSHHTKITNVLVIGSGGAGLRAAIEAKNQNLCVEILGKRNKFDVHTGLAAGGINASFGNIDTQDSWEHHFSDTFLEGYGIGDPVIIELMTKEAPKLVKEIDNWGANFSKLKDGKLDQRFFGAHTYRRTCYSGDYTGQSILKALLNKVDSLNIPIYDSHYVTDLLIEGKQCFGAMSIDILSGERVLYLADAVILCTGGHTRIWKRSSSRRNENTGDGLHLALKAGCDLIDMEMVQFHPTGMLIPEEISGTLVTEAVRGEGGKLFNSKGERFMTRYDSERMELSTRDRVAIANYTEISEGRSTPNGGVYLDISHKDKDFIIKKIPKIYRQFIEAQMLDISKEPMEVAPTAHYSMGGICVEPEEHSSSIKGLYAAGEVAGGLHGANRLGGNSLAEILVFGKRSGEAAALYSKKLTAQIRSNKAIEAAHENINNSIKKGTEISLALQHDLSNIMWEYCGVVKDEHKLKECLRKINTLEKRSNNIDVRISDFNYDDLINKLDFDSSLISAKATILSALERQESRGAHQRSDFPSIDDQEGYNLKVRLKKGTLEVSKVPLVKMRDYLNKIISTSKIVDNFKGKLIE